MKNLGEYIKHPELLGQNEGESLEVLREKYPYFQALHILIAKSHKNRNTYGFAKHLRKAALYAGDRRLLYKFINDVSEKEIKVEKEEKPGLNFENKKAESKSSVTEEIKISPSELDRLFGWEKNSNHNEIEITGRPIFEVVGDKIKKNESPEIIEEKKLQEDIPKIKQIEEIQFNTNHSEIVASETLNIQELKTDIEVHSVEPELHETSEITVEEPLNEATDSEREIEPITPVEDADISKLQYKDEAIEVEPEPEKIENEAPLPEIEIASKAKKEPDFYDWLDDYSISKPNTKEGVISEKETEIAENIIENDLSNKTEKVEISPPINDIQKEIEQITSTEDDEQSNYDPAGWAEIAYDIQAFVKHPETPEENINSHKFPSKSEIDELLDRFIKKNPSISRPKAEFFKPENMARKSEAFHPDVASETLAGIFYKQGLLHQSLEIYEKLMLQIPDKKDIFAARINSIKEELINRL